MQKLLLLYHIEIYTHKKYFLSLFLFFFFSLLFFFIFSFLLFCGLLFFLANNSVVQFQLKVVMRKIKMNKLFSLYFIPPAFTFFLLSFHSVFLVNNKKLLCAQLSIENEIEYSKIFLCYKIKLKILYIFRKSVQREDHIGIAL